MLPVFKSGGLPPLTNPVLTALRIYFLRARMDVSCPHSDTTHSNHELSVVPDSRVTFVLNFRMAIGRQNPSIVRSGYAHIFVESPQTDSSSTFLRKHLISSFQYSLPNGEHVKFQSVRILGGNAQDFFRSLRHGTRLFN